MIATRSAAERVEWEAPLRRGEVDRCGLGVIDERAKKFSPAERRIAEYLADKGPAVVSVSEGFGACGRTADARVDGTPVEFKSLDRGAGDQTVKAALNIPGPDPDSSVRALRRVFALPLPQTSLLSHYRG